MGSEEFEIVLVFVSAAVIVAILASLVALFVVIYQKRILAQDAKLQRLETERQKELLKATIAGQERERKRLAKELHDGVGSLLTGLNLHVQSHETGDPNRTHQFIEQTSQSLEQGIQDIRRISHDLLPGTLERHGLVEALQEHIRPMEGKDFPKIQLDLDGAPRRLPVEMELGVLRVTQELIQNTLRHAHATTVNILLNFTPESLELHYQDDGVGLANANKNPGIGMMNMESRVGALDGTISSSTRTPGYQLSIHLPIPANDD